MRHEWGGCPENISQWCNLSVISGGNGSLVSSREDLCEAGLDDGGVELRSVRTGLGEEAFPSQLYSQVSKAGGKALAGAKVRLNRILLISIV